MYIEFGTLANSKNALVACCLLGNQSVISSPYKLQFDCCLMYQPLLFFKLKALQAYFKIFKADVMTALECI